MLPAQPQRGAREVDELRRRVLYQLFEILSDSGDERLALTRGNLDFYETVAKSDARPGIQNFSKNTLPEANRMVRDLRELSESLRALTERVDQGGVGSVLGPQKLPDYKPRDGK